MRRPLRRKQPTRAELIERKHRLQGEIRALTAEQRRRQARNQSTSHIEGQLDRLRSRHYQTRQEIDRADP